MYKKTYGIIIYLKINKIFYILFYYRIINTHTDTII